MPLKENRNGNIAVQNGLSSTKDLPDWQDTNIKRKVIYKGVREYITA